MNRASRGSVQESSFSYRSYHWPTEWERVGLYQDGKLVWGIEPNAWDTQQLEKLVEKQNRLGQAKS